MMCGMHNANCQEIHSCSSILRTRPWQDLPCWLLVSHFWRKPSNHYSREGVPSIKSLTKECPSLKKFCRRWDLSSTLAGKVAFWSVSKTFESVKSVPSRSCLLSGMLLMLSPCHYPFSPQCSHSSPILFLNTHLTLHQYFPRWPCLIRYVYRLICCRSLWARWSMRGPP